MTKLSRISDKSLQDAMQAQNYSELGTCFHCSQYEARVEVYLDYAESTLHLCEDCAQEDWSEEAVV